MFEIKVNMDTNRLCTFVEMALSVNESSIAYDKSVFSNENETTSSIGKIISSIISFFTGTSPPPLLT